MTDAAPSQDARSRSPLPAPTARAAPASRPTSRPSPRSVSTARPSSPRSPPRTRGACRASKPVPAAFVAAQLDFGAVRPRRRRHQDRHAGRCRDRGDGGARAARRAAPRPLVVDPVMVATSGDVLLKPEAVDAVKRQLDPAGHPDHAQSARGRHPARLRQGRERGRDGATRPARCSALGCSAVLVKGGHGSGDVALDILADGRGHRALRQPARRHPPHPRHRLHAVRRHRRAAGAGRDARRGRAPRQGLRMAGLAAWPWARRRPRPGSGRPSVCHSPQCVVLRLATGMAHRDSMVRASHVGAALVQRPKIFCRSAQICMSKARAEPFAKRWRHRCRTRCLARGRVIGASPAAWPSPGR